MKHEILLWVISTFLLGYVPVVSAQSNLEISTEEVTISDSDIKFLGAFQGTKNKSLPVMPVRAFLSGDELNIQFVIPSGEVAIRILSDFGELYSNFMDSDQQNLLIIPIDKYALGNYKLELVTPTGGYIYGWFTIQE